MNNNSIPETGFNYVGVAYVKPINKGGQSVSNRVVLCPNHHKAFDYGDLGILKQSFDGLSGLLNGKDF